MEKRLHGAHAKANPGGGQRIPSPPLPSPPSKRAMLRQPPPPNSARLRPPSTSRRANQGSGTPTDLRRGPNQPRRPKPPNAPRKTKTKTKRRQQQAKPQIWNPPPPGQTNRKFLRSPFHRRGRPQRRPRRSAAGRPASGPPRRRLRWGGARPAAWPWGGQMERPPLSLSSSSSAFLSSRLLSSLLSPRRGGWLGLAWLGDHEMRPSFFFPLCFFIPFFHHPLQEDGVFSYKGLEFREIAGGVGLSEARSYISAPRGSYL